MRIKSLLMQGQKPPRFYGLVGYSRTTLEEIWLPFPIFLVVRTWNRFLRAWAWVAYWPGERREFEEATKAAYQEGYARGVEEGYCRSLDKLNKAFDVILSRGRPPE